jgi:hypothetical protein
MIQSKARQIALVLSTMAVFGAGIGPAYTRDGGFPYERTGDTDSINSPSSNQMTPIETAGGGGAGGGAGGAGGASSAAGSGTRSSAGTSSGSGQMGGSKGTRSGSSGMTGTGGTSGQ